MLVAIVIDAHRDGSRTIAAPGDSGGDLEHVLGDAMEVVREQGLPDV